MNEYQMYGLGCLTGALIAKYFLIDASEAVLFRNQRSKARYFQYFLGTVLTFVPIGAVFAAGGEQGIGGVISVGGIFTMIMADYNLGGGA